MKNIRIMVVEDEEMLLQAISKKLSHMGFMTISCISASQALDYLSNMKDELPDAIWLDYYLGDMNGLDFMNKLKENKEWAKIPVFVVSNSASEDKRKSMMALGVQKYILKAEHRIVDIASEIRNYLDKS